MNHPTKLATLIMLASLYQGAIAADQVQSPTPKDAVSYPAAKDPSSAAPATSREAPAPLFKELDTNSDSFVTKEEAKRSTEVTTRFTELDTNRDGKVSAAEFTKGTQPKM